MTSDTEPHVDLTVSGGSSRRNVLAPTIINKEKYDDETRYSAYARSIARSDWRQMICNIQILTYNAMWVRCVYIGIAVIFIPIGIFLYSLSQSVTEQQFTPYDKLSECSLDDEDWGKQCNVIYTIKHDFDPPIYFHYKLTNFYQNHRSYVKSRSEVQLRNEAKGDVSECDPMRRYDGKKLLPCGLIANSFFNDKYLVTLIDTTGNETELCPSSSPNCGSISERGKDWSSAAFYSSDNWDRRGIAWGSDRKRRFAATTLNNKLTQENILQQKQNITLPDTNDPDLIVWMRTATTPSFKKLHRVVNKLSFKKGDKLKITITNYFDVSAFGGTKSLLISTKNALGGRNDALGVCFMTIGSISLMTALLFWLLIPPSSVGGQPIELLIASWVDNNVNGK